MIGFPQTYNAPFYKIVKEGKTVGYLLGTIHRLNTENSELSEKIIKAFKKSSIIAFEDDEHTRDLPSTNFKPYFPQIPQERLPDVLARLDAYENRLDGIEVDGKQRLLEDIAKIRSLCNHPEADNIIALSSLFMDVSRDFVEQVYTPCAGVEDLLKTKIDRSRQTIIGLDSDEDVIELNQLYLNFYFSKETRVRVLEGYLSGESLNIQIEDIHILTSWWKKGDPEAPLRVNYFLNTEIETLLEQNNRNRNLNMAMKSIALMKSQTEERIFIGVGAWHLKGPDSIIKHLQSNGFEVIKKGFRPI